MLSGHTVKLLTCCLMAVHFCTSDVQVCLLYEVLCILGEVGDGKLSHNSWPRSKIAIANFSASTSEIKLGGLTETLELSNCFHFLQKS